MNFSGKSGKLEGPKMTFCMNLIQRNLDQTTRNLAIQGMFGSAQKAKMAFL